jgi:hypothetical protein
MKSKKTFKGKSMRVGGGGKFAKGVADIMAKGLPKKMAEGIMAIRGRAKYGKKKFQAMAIAGKKRAKK